MHCLLPCFISTLTKDVVERSPFINKWTYPHGLFAQLRCLMVMVMEMGNGPVCSLWHCEAMKFGLQCLISGIFFQHWDWGIALNSLVFKEITELFILCQEAHLILPRRKKILLHHFEWQFHHPQHWLNKWKQVNYLSKLNTVKWLCTCPLKQIYNKALNYLIYK